MVPIRHLLSYGGPATKLLQGTLTMALPVAGTHVGIAALASTVAPIAVPVVTGFAVIALMKRLNASENKTLNKM